MQIIINPEFRDLIPELSADELKQLEENILQEGCRDPLVLWGDTLIDGHHRYEIAQRHGLKFKTVQREFDSEDEAQQWIIQNQFGRRNLSAYDRSVLALKLKPMLAAQAKKRQGTRNDLRDIPQKSAGCEAREQIAKAAGVSRDTIGKVEAIEKEGTPDLKDKVKRGVLSINKAYLEVRQKKQQDPPKPPEPVQEPEAASTARRCKFSVADHLMHGQENALTARDLQRILGVTGPELRRRVHDERMSGTPILSSTDMRNPGYYLPERGDEIRRFATCLRKRGQEIIEAADALEAGAVDEVA